MRLLHHVLAHDEPRHVGVHARALQLLQALALADEQRVGVLEGLALLLKALRGFRGSRRRAYCCCCAGGFDAQHSLYRVGYGLDEGWRRGAEEGVFGCGVDVGSSCRGDGRGCGVGIIGAGGDAFSTLCGRGVAGGGAGATLSNTAGSASGRDAGAVLGGGARSGWRTGWFCRCGSDVCTRVRGVDWMKEEKEKRREMRGVELSFLMRLPIKLRSLMAEDCGALDVSRGRCRFLAVIAMGFGYPRTGGGSMYNSRRTRAVIVEQPVFVAPSLK